MAVLLIASCGLRLDEEAVQVAAALHLRLSICITHACLCGSQVDAQDLRTFLCKLHRENLQDIMPSMK